MRSKGRKVLTAFLVSSLLLAAVFYFADLKTIRFEDLQLRFICLSIACYILMLILRALSYAILAGRRLDINWLTLATRHQLVFLFTPSGFGDVFFPSIARQTVGENAASSLTTLLSVRIRDLAILLGLGSIGLAGIGKAPWYILIIPVISLAISLFLDQFLKASLIYIIRYGPRFSDRITAAIRNTSVLQQTVSTLISLGIWIASSVALYAGFRVAGWHLSIYEVWIILAGINFAGALAVSIAGLGVSELGATGVLVFLGTPVTKSATIAVIARPVLLLSLVTACLILEGATTLRKFSQR